MQPSRPTLYVETTVPSYQVARPSRDVIVLAHQKITWDWWQESLPSYEAYVSPAVLDEVSRGDPEAAKMRLSLLAEFPVLEATDEVEKLTRLYMYKLSLPENAGGDAAHLAFACSYGLDYLVTWNCAHIANATIRRQLEKINSSEDRDTPVICTPEELVELKEF